MTTSDNDFIDLDTLQKGNKRCAIICHGLEGSSQSQYVIGLSSLLCLNGWDTIAMNYRGCSGEINLKCRFYHSGATEDLDDVVNAIGLDYEEISLIGFSLGGNLVLKYSGERPYGISSKIKAIVAVSVPVNLKAGSLNINKKSNYFYSQNFLKSLKHKVVEKEKQYPGSFRLKEITEINSLYEFDDLVTGPIHGFKNAHDYYAKCSSKQFLKNINLSTLIVSALDDPFLPEECYPFEEAKKNDKLTLMTPKYGGHCGFANFNNTHYWIENQIKDFLIKKSELNT